jgi:hypothetical protein
MSPLHTGKKVIDAATWSLRVSIQNLIATLLEITEALSIG